MEQPVECRVLRGTSLRGRRLLVESVRILWPGLWMVWRRVRRHPAFDECAGTSADFAGQRAATVSEEVLIGRGYRRDAQTNRISVWIECAPLRMCHGVLCSGMDDGLCSVRASNATAGPAGLHARSWICGLPKLYLLAWSRIWLWNRIWSRVLGWPVGILWWTIRPAGIRLVRWLWRLWCSTSAVEYPGSPAFASASRASAIQEEVLSRHRNHRTNLDHNERGQ